MNKEAHRIILIPKEITESSILKFCGSCGFLNTENNCCGRR